MGKRRWALRLPLHKLLPWTFWYGRYIKKLHRTGVKDWGLFAKAFGPDEARMAESMTKNEADTT